MKFKDGESRIKDKPYSGGPSTATTNTKHHRVNELIHADRQATMHEYNRIVVPMYSRKWWKTLGY